MLVPSTQSREIKRSKKVGIRAQLYSRKEQKLVMDFLLEKGESSTHVLNAISPGFTCGPSFASYVVDQALCANEHPNRAFFSKSIVSWMPCVSPEVKVKPLVLNLALETLYDN